jgi:hypothetical protein
MAYRVHISDEQGVGIPGVILFYDLDGLQIASYEIPVGGIDLPPELVDVAAAFHVDSPGYIGYDALQLGELSNITLVRDTSVRAGITVLVVIGLFVAYSFIKK